MSAADMFRRMGISEQGILLLKEGVRQPRPERSAPFEAAWGGNRNLMQPVADLSLNKHPA